MTRLTLALCAASLALAGQPQAAVRCTQPYAPVIKINASATAKDMATLRDDVNSFIAASDVFQSCLVAQRNATDSRLAANQAQKERVGREFNEALKAFKRANPGA